MISISAPLAVIKLNCVSNTPNSIIVTWEKSPRAGPTNYTIVAKDIDGPGDTHTTDLEGMCAIKV